MKGLHGKTARMSPSGRRRMVFFRQLRGCRQFAHNPVSKRITMRLPDWWEHGAVRCSQVILLMALIGTLDGTSSEASEVRPRDYFQPTLQTRFRSTPKANDREITGCEKRKGKTARGQNMRIGRERPRIWGLSAAQNFVGSLPPALSSSGPCFGRVQRSGQTFCNAGCNCTIDNERRRGTWHF